MFAHDKGSSIYLCDELDAVAIRTDRHSLENPVVEFHFECGPSHDAAYRDTKRPAHGPCCGWRLSSAWNLTIAANGLERADVSTRIVR